MLAQTVLSLPEGAFTGRSDGRRYRIVKTVMAGGRSVKLVAEEIGGTDYVSFNLYLLRRQAALRPCEMSRAKVVRFVECLVPDAPAQDP